MGFIVSWFGEKMAQEGSLRFQLGFGRLRVSDRRFTV